MTYFPCQHVKIFLVVDFFREKLSGMLSDLEAVKAENAKLREEIRRKKKEN